MTARRIEISRLDEASPGSLRFLVVVREGNSATRHEASMTRGALERLGGGLWSAEQCLDAAFRFLLDREPKEQILARFDVSVISLYFPEFERELKNYLAHG